MEPIENVRDDIMQHERYVATERYVQSVLRLMGQSEDADNPMLVGRITSKIIRAFPIWAHSDSPLRRRDAQ